jgi:hypothetical protein
LTVNEIYCIIAFIGEVAQLVRIDK